MMTIADVLRNKNTVHPHDCADCAGGPELLKVLPSSSEYKAWQALQDGRTSESQSRVLQLLQLERSKPVARAKSDEENLLAIERRIMGVLVALEKVTATNKFDVAEAVTEFLWKKIESSQ